MSSDVVTGYGAVGLAVGTAHFESDSDLDDYGRAAMVHVYYGFPIKGVWIGPSVRASASAYSGDAGKTSTHMKLMVGPQIDVRRGRITSSLGLEFGGHVMRGYLSGDQPGVGVHAQVHYEIFSNIALGLTADYGRVALDESSTYHWTLGLGTTIRL